MTVLLKADALRVAIAGKPVCDTLDLKIQTGQCWAVLGRNGSGKTTLLHTLAGLRPPERGTVTLLDRRLGDWPRRSVAQHLGILFQDHDDRFPSTVFEATLIGRHPFLAPWQWETERDRQIARDALTAVGMTGFESRSVATLSGGERQRVAIATLLTQQPDLLLLDEPTNHLDLHQQIAILDTVTAYIRSGARSLVMILHDANLAARYCDHVILLYGDGDCAAGARRDLLNAECLQRLYGHRIHRLPGPAGDIFIPA